ncbi:MAG: hypothetical protein ISP86_04200 [Shewanellaceae bacterium]|nr:hypothetical protein [Shewanellaceae bacterium]
MALSTRQKNNIILFTCLIMFALLNLMDRYLNSKVDFMPMFDQEHPVYRVEFQRLVWDLNKGVWHCNLIQISCNETGQFWSALQAKPIAEPQVVDTDSKPIRFHIEGASSVLVWSWFPEKSLLQSHSKRWYQLSNAVNEQLNEFVVFSR